MNKYQFAIGAALLLDYANRRDNYNEMVERLEGHIERWENNISKIKDAQIRVNENIDNNKEKLQKAENFYDKLHSTTTQKWLEKQEWAAYNHKSDNVQESARENIKQHCEKVESVESQISRLKSWINEGYEKLDSMNNSINDLEDKIYSANNKIND